MGCILRTCKKCPKYKWNKYEKNISKKDPNIAFHDFTVKKKCTVHGLLDNKLKECPDCVNRHAREKKGKFQVRKLYTLFRKPFKEFMLLHYLPMLDKYAYHRHHVILLGKYETAEDRKKALRPGDVETTRDYAERLSFEFNNEIMSQHFGNSLSLSIEGASVRFFKKKDIDSYQNDKSIVVEQEESVMHFHSHLSDNALQNAATTYHHMKILIKHLLEVGNLLVGNCLYGNTDGSGTQYRCANALYFLSLLAYEFSIIIDRAVGSPGHGKDLVDGLNAVDKRYLKVIMSCIKTAQEDDVIEIKKIRQHTVLGKKMLSLAKECARLLSLDRDEGAKGFKKSLKRELNRVMKKRFYHTREENEVKIHDKLSMKTIGLPAGKYNGLRGRYHLHFDPQLGVGKAAIRRIPCGCESCIKMKHISWDDDITNIADQPRFAHNAECKYIKIFSELNDWIIVSIENKDKDNEWTLEEIKKEVTMGIVGRICGEIKVGSFGAYMINNNESNVYKIVKWESTPYTSQNCIKKIKDGELIISVSVFAPVSNRKNWYTSTNEKILVQVSNIVHPNIEMEKSSEDSEYPSQYKKKHVKKNQLLVKITNDTHEYILNEISQRDLIKFDGFS